MSIIDPNSGRKRTADVKCQVPIRSRDDINDAIVQGEKHVIGITCTLGDGVSGLGRSCSDSQGQDQSKMESHL